MIILKNRCLATNQLIWCPSQIYFIKRSFIKDIKYWAKESGCQTNLQEIKDKLNKTEKAHDIYERHLESTGGVIQNMFYGRINSSMFHYQKASYSKKRVDEIIYSIESCDWSDSQKNFENLTQLGLFGSCFIGKEYGGMHLTCSEFLQILTHPSVLPYSLMLISHQALCGLTIQLFGTEEQKKRYLPKMASGEIIGAFCAYEFLDEPDIDNGVMKTTGEIPFSYNKNEESDDIQFVVNGTKTGVINGNCANLFVVLVNTKDGVNEGARIRQSIFLIDKGLPGVSVNVENYTGRNQSNSTNYADIEFTDVFLDKNNLLYRQNTANMIIDSLNSIFGCIQSAVLCGLGRYLIGEMKWNSSILLDDSIRRIFSMESAVYYTSRLFDEDKTVENLETESNCTKILCTKHFLEILKSHTNKCHDEQPDWIKLFIRELTIPGHLFYTRIVDYDITRSLHKQTVTNQLEPLWYNTGRMIIRECISDCLNITLLKKILGSNLAARQEYKRENRSFGDPIKFIPGATDSFWFIKEALSLHKALLIIKNNFLFTASHPKKVNPLNLTDLNYLIACNVTTHVYESLCIIARVNTTKSENEKKLAEWNLMELQRQMFLELDFLKDNTYYHKYQFLYGFIDVMINEGTGQYMLHDAIDVRRDITDVSYKRPRDFAEKMKNLKNVQY